MAEQWAVVPFVVWEMTEQAVLDLLAQTGCSMRVLLIDKSEDDEIRKAAERLADRHFPRVLLWSGRPALSSLAASWNSALDFVWQTGATRALVCNQDLRFHPNYWQRLHEVAETENALFVSGIGVSKEQWEGSSPTQNDSRGGPDFSAFLISRECHERFRFDENFTPAYCEDLDTRRRVLLAGEGHRMYSIDLPYWHVDKGSGTLKNVSSERRERLERAIASGSRAHYEKKWGGPVNHERWNVPFADVPSRDGLCTTTPDLERHGCGGCHPDDGTRSGPDVEKPFRNESGESS